VGCHNIPLYVVLFEGCCDKIVARPPTKLVALRAMVIHRLIGWREHNQMITAARFVDSFKSVPGGDE